MEDLWPSEVCLQGPASNHPERHWLKTVVVSVGGKGRSKRFVRYGLRRRAQANHHSGVEKALEDTKTRGPEYPWDESIGDPADWVGGVRRRGGVSSIRAHPWNCGNSGCDAKRKDQVGSGRQGPSPAGESPAVSVARNGHVAMPQFGVGNSPFIAWCKRPGRPAGNCSGGCNRGV
jgi:hypothetical protein